MKRIIALLFVFSAFATAGDSNERYSDPAGYEYVDFNLSFVPGISIGDERARYTGKQIVNSGFSLSLIGNRAARLNGLELAGIFSIYEEEIRGVQLAGIFNLNGSDVRGLQMSGIFNMANGSVRGLQGSGIFNINNGEVRGLQFTGVFNINNGGVQGLQFADVFNIANGRISGMQWGGVFNVANGAVSGLQMSGGVNIARSVHGGAQIGFVNVSGPNDGAVIGLVSYVSDVPFAYQVYGDETQMVHAALRSGNHKWYNLFGAGRRVEGTTRYNSIDGGFGRYFDLGYRLGLDLGLHGSYLLTDDLKDNAGFITRFSTSFHYNIGYRAAIVVGGSVNIWSTKVVEDELSRGLWKEYSEDEYFFRIWPGLHVGLKL